MQNLLPHLPKIDTLLQEPTLEHLHKPLLKKIAQNYIQSLRTQILDNTLSQVPDYPTILATLQARYHSLTTPTLKPLINATGVVLQTNLGRSIFSEKIINKILPLLSQYTNLEYDIQQGKRGERYSHIREIICTLFDCEDALVVNNNAAAVMLIINTFAKDKEVLISRGELVEIGGSFRIPEVIKQSGAILQEVGSTNKTHLKDYQNALTPNTAMAIKVHQSNFAQIGFTQDVPYPALKEFAQRHGIIDYYDVGSGYITGITSKEPSLLEIAKADPSLVSFSGDKLLGGAQAGIIFGKAELISQLKQNHLLRALRIDKISLALLQETLLAYLTEELDSIPTLQMLRLTQAKLEERANTLESKLKAIKNLTTQTIKTDSKAGGGSLPTESFPSYGVQVRHAALSAQSFSTKLRQAGLIARIHNDEILLDVRCIDEKDFEKIEEIIRKICEA